MERSIVEYLSGHEGYSCGYCHSSDTCFSHGMWAHTLSTLDYQYLIDRGWRRSGKYCYKPTMHLTCCPLYTIRCAAKQLSLTRSQKKVLKKVHRFLCYGEKAKSSEASSSKDESDHDMEVSEYPQEIDMQSLKRIKKVNQINYSDISADESATIDTDSLVLQGEISDNPATHSPVKSSHISPPKSNPSSPVKSSSLNVRPQCRKAKEIRKERKLQKLLQKGISQEEATESLKKTTNEPKSLEDFLYQSFPSEPAHKLELRLVPASLETVAFASTYDVSHQLFVKYQMKIHNDKEDECTKQDFDQFLIETPFEETRNTNPAMGKISYGSFHQQYWLDNKLIAVGVMDILPYCVSSVYFFYDPDYSFLSLGTYAALREIALVRELNKKLPDLQYYYMGFYIHSCVKMRYKGQFVPSFLLCPETYIFQPIEKSKPKLENAKYCRLEDDPTNEDSDGSVILREVLILFERTKMSYPAYHLRNPAANDEAEVREYAAFVGKKCYRRMLLYRDA